MRLSTSINLYEKKYDGSLFDPTESVRVLHENGYRVMDMDLALIPHPDFFLLQPDWERRTHEIAQCAADLGVEFSQCHIPFYSSNDPNWLDPVRREWFEGLVKRAYHAAAILGVRWATVHALTDMEDDCRIESSKRLNIEYFSPYIELAKKLGVGVSIENMCDFYKSPCRRRYTIGADELVDLVDTFNDPSVGITWDTGHANIQGYRHQSKHLHQIGSRLTSLHINDNMGLLDVHLLPFTGTVDWQDVMTALKEIDYLGDLTYEAHGHNNHMPDELKPDCLRFSVQVGNRLLEMAR